MAADRARRAELHRCHAACPVRHQRADVVVVVVQGPAALVERRAQARVPQGDHRPDRALPRRHRRRPGDQEAALRDLEAVDHRVDVVDAAEVPRRLQGERERAPGVGPGLREHDGQLVRLASEVVDAVGARIDDPGRVRGVPDDRDVPAGGEAGARKREPGAGHADVGLRPQDAHLRRGLRGRRERARQGCDAGNRRGQEGAGSCAPGRRHDQRSRRHAGEERDRSSPADQLATGGGRRRAHGMTVIGYPKDPTFPPAVVNLTWIVTSPSGYVAGTIQAFVQNQTLYPVAPWEPQFSGTFACPGTEKCASSTLSIVRMAPVARS